MTTNRTRSVRALLGGLLAAAALAPQARAGAAPLLTYQGRLKESGLPVTAVRPVDVQICDALTGGVCYGTGGAQNVSVSNGLFRTTFTLSGVDLSTGPWYLEVRVSAVPLSPREQLTASPYALYASSAATLAAAPGSPGVTIATSVFLGGAVGIGTTNPVLTLSLGNAAARSFGVEDAGAMAAPGNSLSVQAGAGGLTTSGGAGGNLILQAGNANGTGVNNGGFVLIKPGSPTSTGASGYVEIASGAGAAHLRATQTTNPGATTAGCGTGGNASVNGADMAGVVMLNTGTAPGACTVTVNFYKPYGLPPKAVLITPMGGATPGLNASVQISPGAANFIIQANVGVAPSTSYMWSYFVIE